MSAEINADTSLNDLPAYVRKSFRGSIKKIRLKPGMKIYVLSKRRQIGEGQVEAINPWWSMYDRYKRDTGYEGRTNIAGNSGNKLLQLLKDTAAYDGKKAGGRYAVVARVRIPMWGFYGIIRRKGTISKERAYQLYIPNLTEHAIKRANVHNIF